MRPAREGGRTGRCPDRRSYLFRHTPAQRIQAGTQPENIAEQKSLIKAGFHREGVIRAAECRAGEWRDGVLFSRLRIDPSVQW